MTESSCDHVNHLYLSQLIPFPAVGLGMQAADARKMLMLAACHRTADGIDDYFVHPAWCLKQLLHQPSSLIHMLMMELRLRRLQRSEGPVARLVFGYSLRFCELPDTHG